MMSALDVPRDRVEIGFRSDPMATTTYMAMTMFFGPKLTVAAGSAPIPLADPKPLFWVTGIVLGLLALWVIYVVVKGETRKERTAPSSPEPKTSGDGAE